MSKHIIETFYEDEELKVTIELHDDILYSHVDIYENKPSVIKKLKNVWEYGKHVAWLNGFDAVHTYTKNPKFAKLLGEYEKLGEAYDEKGDKLEVLQWVL